jgi:hypothetical protein
MNEYSSTFDTFIRIICCKKKPIYKHKKNYIDESKSELNKLYINKTTSKKFSIVNSFLSPNKKISSSLSNNKIFRTYTRKNTSLHVDFKNIKIPKNSNNNLKNRYKFSMNKLDQINNKNDRSLIININNNNNQNNNSNNNTTRTSKDRKFFHEFKDKLRCFFCGGVKCKHENYLLNIENKNAIIGLNSNYITNDIIASQRPSEVLIEEFSLVQKFKDLNIGLIVNLQREGEHPYCGPNAYNLTSAGYSYNPTSFSGDGIKVKLLGWKDMEVPHSMNFMLDIVKEMSSKVYDDKMRVLVHCHAGYGRTGVVIVCYLLYNSNKNSKEVIDEVRSKRKKCVETKEQIRYCQKFEKFLIHCRTIFGECDSIENYLKKQEDILFGEELKKIGYIPIIIEKSLDKIIELKNKLKINKVLIYKLIQGELIDWNEQLENLLIELKLLINQNKWEKFDLNENLMIVIELMFDWFEDCVKFVINPERTDKIINNEIFMEYVNNNGNKTNRHSKCDIIVLLKKEFHLFEYQIIFKFAEFLVKLSKDEENNKNYFENTVINNSNNNNSNFNVCNSEKKNNKINDELNSFNQMIYRISLELLGFSYNETYNDNKYQTIILPLVNGLCNIIKIIYEILSKNIYSYEELEIISPKKNNYTSITKKNLNISNFSETNINNNNTSYINCMTGNSNTNINKEKKLFQLYKMLQEHFSDKKSNFNTNLDENGGDKINRYIQNINLDVNSYFNSIEDNNASSINIINYNNNNNKDNNNINNENNNNKNDLNKNNNIIINNNYITNSNASNNIISTTNKLINNNNNNNILNENDLKLNKNLLKKINKQTTNNNFNYEDNQNNINFISSKSSSNKSTNKIISDENKNNNDNNNFNNNNNNFYINSKFNKRKKRLNNMTVMYKNTNQMFINNFLNDNNKNENKNNRKKYLKRKSIIDEIKEFEDKNINKKNSIKKMRNQGLKVNKIKDNSDKELIHLMLKMNDNENMKNLFNKS